MKDPYKEDSIIRLQMWCLAFEDLLYYLQAEDKFETVHSFLALVHVSADRQAYGNPIQRSLNLMQSKLPQLLTLVEKINLHRLMNCLEFESGDTD